MWFVIYFSTERLMSRTPAVAYRPTKDFTFDKITISTNGKKVGGWYFAKIAHDKRPLYMEIPEVLTKSGIVKVNNQSVCDLIFNPDEEDCPLRCSPTKTLVFK